MLYIISDVEKSQSLSNCLLNCLINFIRKKTDCPISYEFSIVKQSLPWNLHIIIEDKCPAFSEAGRTLCLTLLKRFPHHCIKPTSLIYGPHSPSLPLSLSLSLSLSFSLSLSTFVCFSGFSPRTKIDEKKT